MTTIQIPYGNTQIEVKVDAEVLDLEEGERPRGKSINPRAVITRALSNPLGTKRLREIVAAKKDAKIVIVVDDHTRATPTVQMLDAVKEEIGEEYNKQISLLVACGTHEPPTEADLKKILGNYVGHYRIEIHDCDASDLIYVGTTTRGTPVKVNKNYEDADVKILTGDITLHYYAGFGGGRKSILPGVSSRATIQKNHALLINEHARTANLEHNPVHLDMTEAASFCPPDFVLNIIATGEGAIVDAYAGEMTAVFQRGVEVAKDLFCRDIHEVFDVLVVSAGGFPKDRNLYQASKAIENCYRAVAPGGDLILVAECKEGMGDPYFEDWMHEHASYEQAAEAVRTNFVLGGHKAYYMRKVMTRVRLSIVSDLDPQLLSAWGIEPFPSVEEALGSLKEDIGKIGIVRKGADTLLVPTVK
ncbi:MAG: nickel-dependent lactate racemase [Methanomicrobia archaeon]|nr:nickel-dependent lactate racemase [Methanomicrobia archaeon]